MYLKLLMYLGILCLGIIIGYKDLLGKALYKYLDIAQTIAVLSLLFVMGLRMGLDREVIDSIAKIGFSAGIIAVFAVGFSMLFVYAGRKLFLESSKKKEAEGSYEKEVSGGEY